MKDKDIESIIGWFDQIAQIARDRKTGDGIVMSKKQALDAIESVALDAAYFVMKYMNGE